MYNAEPTWQDIFLISDGQRGNLIGVHGLYRCSKNTLSHQSAPRVNLLSARAIGLPRAIFSSKYTSVAYYHRVPAIIYLSHVVNWSLNSSVVTRLLVLAILVFHLTQFLLLWLWKGVFSVVLFTVSFIFCSYFSCCRSRFVHDMYTCIHEKNAFIRLLISFFAECVCSLI